MTGHDAVLQFLLAMLVGIAPVLTGNGIATEEEVNADSFAEHSVLPGRGPTPMLLAGRARGRNPHGPAHTGRQRRRRRRWRRWRRIISLPNILGDVPLPCFDPVIAVADIHVPSHLDPRPTLRDIHRLPRAPLTGRIVEPARRLGLGGTCTHTGQTQTARHQHGCC